MTRISVTLHRFYVQLIFFPKIVYFMR